MRHVKLIGLGLLAFLSLFLAACGRAPTQAWPGLVTDGSVAYVAQGLQLHAIELESQRELWPFPSAADNNIGSFVSEPGLSPDVIVIGSEGPSGSYSGLLFGIDPATGDQRWCLAFDEKARRRLPGCQLADGATPAGPLGIAPAVDNRVVGAVTLVDGIAYVGLANGAMYAVDAGTGDDLWHFRAERDVWSAPVVSDDTIYVASLDHRVYALDRATGVERWAQDMDAAIAGTPTLVGGTLYVGTFGNRLCALDAATGERRWDFTTRNWVWSGPALADGVLYLTDVGGWVYAVDVETRSELWSVRPGGQMRARPTVSGDLLYVGDRGGNLFALSRADGRVVHQLAAEQKPKGELLVSPVVVDGLVLVAPFKGERLLIAFSTDLQFRWAIPVPK